jgi:ankyrin repeat protein
MFKILLILLILITVPYSQQKTIPQIAVSDLIGQGINQSEVNVVTEQLRAELLKAGHFRIIERSQMQEILKEQGFQQTGCTTDACAVQVGQMLGVSDIVVGTLGIAGSYTVLAIRILDVQTGEVLVNETVKTNGIDKMIEGGICEAASKLVASFTYIINKNLIEAVNNGNLLEVEKILQQGADVNAKDKDGWSALHIAVNDVLVEIVNTLVRKGADVAAMDGAGATPLHYAASRGNIEEIKILLSNGADVNAQDSLGWTPLRWAVRNGNMEAIKLLVTRGANVNAKDRRGSAALHGSNMINVVKLLLARGSLVNAKDSLGETPLFIAAWRGYKDIASSLIESGADVNAETIYGGTPLQEAATHGHREIVDLLLQKHAEINARDHAGYTSLHYALRAGQKDIVELLRRHGGIE